MDRNPSYMIYNGVCGAHVIDKSAVKSRLIWADSPMSILSEIRIRNFKCFRSEIRIPLRQSTYLAGENNSGKSAVLEAVRCFMDDTAFGPDHINRTEFAAKKEGFNRSDISIVLDLQNVMGKTRNQRVRSQYGETLTVAKAMTWRVTARSIATEYYVAGAAYTWESIPGDVREILSAISISYIHPQEGAELLAQAQDKFKQRLFHNWGRHASVAEKVKNVEEQWAELRATANSYLSSALSNRLRRIWPNAEVKVDLPEEIKDIVAVSDITFRTSPTLPQISLTSHGTGAQSAILYQTHYVLDSDRSLHQGQYYPVWLLEEPESFLHADIAMQIARLLSSDEWLSSIQMLIATHSPIILAGSMQNPDKTSWALCHGAVAPRVHCVEDVDEDTIFEVGNMMGDGNFGVYFEASASDYRVFLEDSRNATAKKFEEAGVPEPIPLNGVSDVERHLRVLVPLSGAAGVFYFVVDNDSGIKELRKWIDSGKEVYRQSGWRKIDCGGSCFLLLLPEGYAVEHLFDKWSEVLDSAVEDLYDIGRKELRATSPMDLTRAAGAVRGSAPSDPEEGRKVIAKQGDVKDRFWNVADSAVMAGEHRDALCALLNLSGGEN